MTFSPFAPQRTEVVELGKRALVPGFYDAHQHQVYAGLAEAQVDARTASIEELVERLRRRAGTLPSGSWVEAAGYDETRFAERRNPTRDDLDRASTQHPILVTRTCGHVMVLNSAALAEAGVDRTTPDPDGGHVDRAADSDEPTGLLRERAMEFARRVVQQPGPDALERAILDAGAREPPPRHHERVGAERRAAAHRHVRAPRGGEPPARPRHDGAEEGAPFR